MTDANQVILLDSPMARPCYIEHNWRGASEKL